MRVKVQVKQEQREQKKPVIVIFPDGSKEEIKVNTPEELAKKLGNYLKKRGIRSFRFRVNGKNVEIDAAEQWMPDLVEDGGSVEVIPIAEAGRCAGVR